MNARIMIRIADIGTMPWSYADATTKLPAATARWRWPRSRRWNMKIIRCRNANAAATPMKKWVKGPIA